MRPGRVPDGTERPIVHHNGGATSVERCYRDDLSVRHFNSLQTASTKSDKICSNNRCFQRVRKTDLLADRKPRSTRDAGVVVVRNVGHVVGGDGEEALAGGLQTVGLGSQRTVARIPGNG